MIQVAIAVLPLYVIVTIVWGAGNYWAYRDSARWARLYARSEGYSRLSESNAREALEFHAQFKRSYLWPWDLLAFLVGQYKVWRAGRVTVEQLRTWAGTDTK